MKAALDRTLPHLIRRFGLWVVVPCRRVLLPCPWGLTFATLMFPSIVRSTSSAKASHVGASLMHHTHHGAYCGTQKSRSSRSNHSSTVGLVHTQGGLIDDVITTVMYS